MTDKIILNVKVLSNCSGIWSGAFMIIKNDTDKKFLGSMTLKL